MSGCLKAYAWKYRLWGRLMPKPTHDPHGVSRHGCEHASEIRLVDVRYRTMTAEEDREAVAAVAALIRALRTGHHPAATPAEGNGDA